jgi:hypothetical protein
MNVTTHFHLVRTQTGYFGYNQVYSVSKLIKIALLKIRKCREVWLFKLLIALRTYGKLFFETVES